MFSLLDFCEFHVFLVNYHIYILGCGVYLPPRSNRFSSMDPLPEAFHQAIPGLSSNAQYSTTRQPGGPGPIPIAFSWNSRYLFELIYISSDFDHGDVIQATASTAMLVDARRSLFSQQKIHQHHGVTRDHGFFDFQPWRKSG